MFRLCYFFVYYIIMEFGDLELRWKILVVMGILFTIISVILIIIFILFFKTDLLEYTNGGEEPDISEFDFLFSEKKTEGSEEPDKDEGLEDVDNVSEPDFLE